MLSQWKLFRNKRGMGPKARGLYLGGWLMCCGPRCGEQRFLSVASSNRAGAQREACGRRGAAPARTQGHTNGLFSRTGLVGGSDIKGPLERLELSALWWPHAGPLASVTNLRCMWEGRAAGTPASGSGALWDGFCQERRGIKDEA